ncbi:MAG: HAD hydrolase-like protein [Clostridiales bacterium]|nr:HAD hydrolase-like protein [Clostridiales bacterium]
MLRAHDTNSEIIINHFENRKICYAFHDIDGTHSLIREWPPVMSICLYNVIVNGLPEDFDSKENEKRLIESCGTKVLSETDRFCIESAGLSALTQMEWAIRRAVEEGTVKVSCNKNTNSEIIKRIWNGEEIFDEFKETDEMREMLAERTPRLFKLYEAVLNGYCRDKNLEKAKENPKDFLVPGSMEFMRFLKEQGVKNYFVTGAVVEKGMGMHEEVEGLGYKIGRDEIVEDILGSTWTEKMPKEMVMKELLEDLKTDGKNVLVVGDGRAEILAGSEMGALVISRLPKSAQYQRKLHKNLGANIIIDNYTNKDLYNIFEPI